MTVVLMAMVMAKDAIERQQSPAAVKLDPTRMVRTVKGNWKMSDKEEVDYEKTGIDLS